MALAVTRVILRCEEAQESQALGRAFKLAQTCNFIHDAIVCNAFWNISALFSTVQCSQIYPNIQGVLCNNFLSIFFGFQIYQNAS